jgi:hypothetical protein
MFELKPIHKEAAPAALEKAHRYRVLNEPLEAESICLDVLEVDPDNQVAIVCLVLALTDQFDRKLNENFDKARALIARLDDEYESIYYEGIICERRGKCALTRGGPGSGMVAYDWFRRGMERYEQAIEQRPADNDDAILRWNTCARVINRDPNVRPDEQDHREHMLE